ncbi:hypothetical protein ACH36K_14050 [Clostridium sp. MB05]|uniref:hypothetical protein n=1 Tax=Clostridium sp. MB05 TaxID=3376682 RepID=UPI003982ABB6
MKKVVLYIILSILIAVNIWIVMLLFNESNLLSKLNFYLVWIVSILIGVITFIVSRKYKINKNIDMIILVVTIASILLLTIIGGTLIITSAIY